MLHENTTECSVGFHYPDDTPTADDTRTKYPGDTLEFARRLVSYIRAQPRARLTVDCIFLALGDSELEGENMTSVASRHGITKAAVSKRVKLIISDLHLPISINNKPDHVRRNHALANCSPLRLDRRAPARS